MESIYCYLCDLGNHSMEDCNISRITTDPLESASENPSEGIHRAIVHPVHLQPCDSYRVLYSRWYPGPEPKTLEKEEVFPVRITGPDYCAIAVIQAVEDLKSTPGVSPSDIRKQKSSGTSVVQELSFSKAFPLNFSEFCHSVAKKFEEDLEEERVIPMSSSSTNETERLEALMRENLEASEVLEAEHRLLSLQAGTLVTGICGIGLF